MAANTSNETLESVYIGPPIEQRANHPLYQSVRELVEKYSVTGEVLDIGCSDGVATFGLEDTVVYGLDLSGSALEAAKQYNPQYNAIQGDIRHLPLNKQGARNIDTVLLLDILEHEPAADTTAFLGNLHGLLRQGHTLITSMPIISPLSIETWREGLHALHAGERPPTGLFDRTHRILTGRNGHINMFKQAGYSVVEEYQTNHLEAVNGDWRWKRDNPALGHDTEEWLGSLGLSEKSLGAVMFAYRSLEKLYNRYHNGNSHNEHDGAAKISEALVAYQGLYVLKPTDTRYLPG